MPPCPPHGWARGRTWACRAVQEPHWRQAAEGSVLQRERWVHCEWHQGVVRVVGWQSCHSLKGTRANCLRVHHCLGSACTFVPRVDRVATTRIGRKHTCQHPSCHQASCAWEQGFCILWRRPRSWCKALRGLRHRIVPVLGQYSTPLNEMRRRPRSVAQLPSGQKIRSATRQSREGKFKTFQRTFLAWQV